MIEHSIDELKGRYSGDDVYIVASGSSIDYVDKSFFANKIVVGVNEAWVKFPNLDFLVRKENARAIDALDSGIPLIVSRFNCGTKINGTENHFPGYEYFVFDHRHNDVLNPDLDVIKIDSDEIVVSYSTITSAMHIACYMGADNVILVGHDCGTLDGAVRASELPGALGGEEFYRKFLRDIEPQSIVVRDRLTSVYGTNIYSLNPFLNFGLEGHKYER